MRADLERDEFITLLERMNSDEDTEVLAAVRDVNAKMIVAGVTWNDLLVSQSDSNDQDNDIINKETGDGVADDDPDLKILNENEVQEATELIKTIGNMEISNLTKDELAEYKTDLKEGDLVQMDLRYLRALKARLSK